MSAQISRVSGSLVRGEFELSHEDYLHLSQVTLFVSATLAAVAAFGNYYFGTKIGRAALNYLHRSQVILFVSATLAAVASFGNYYFGKKVEIAASEENLRLQNEIVRLSFETSKSTAQIDEHLSSLSGDQSFPLVDFSVYTSGESSFIYPNMSVVGPNALRELVVEVVVVVSDPPGGRRLVLSESIPFIHPGQSHSFLTSGKAYVDIGSRHVSASYFINRNTLVSIEATTITRNGVFLQSTTYEELQSDGGRDMYPESDVFKLDSDSTRRELLYRYDVQQSPDGTVRGTSNPVMPPQRESNSPPVEE